MLLLLACATPPEEASFEASTKERVEGLAWFTRASIDLRGVRPTVEELHSAEQDPAAAEQLVLGWLDEPAFASAVAWKYDDTLRTAVWMQNSQTRMFAHGTEAQNRAFGWEPLELVRTIVAEDLPFSHLVTHETLPNHPDLDGFWGQDSTLEEWTWVAYPDRPMAGVLSSSTLWIVHDGDATNQNRRRANFVSAALLCSDMLDRDVRFTISLEEDHEQAIVSVPACMNCHAALDPLASHFGGFPDRSVPADAEKLRGYSGIGELVGVSRTPPGYFGRAGGDLAVLGSQIAADPRFSSCQARRLSQGLLQTTEPTAEELEAWTRSFRDSGLSVRALAAEVLLSESYASDARMVEAEVMPELLADLAALDEDSPLRDELERLRWEADLRVLAASTDDVGRLERNHRANAGTAVVWAWAAQLVADEALAEDALREQPRIWQGEPYPTETQAVREQLAWMHGRALSQPVAPDSAEVDRLVLLLEELDGDWSRLFEALLRHPQGLLY